MSDPVCGHWLAKVRGCPDCDAAVNDYPKEPPGSTCQRCSGLVTVPHTCGKARGVRVRSRELAEGLVGRMGKSTPAPSAPKAGPETLSVEEGIEALYGDGTPKKLHRLRAILEAVDAAAYQRGCMDVETFDQNILAEHIAAAEKRGAASVRKALGVQPAGDGYIFLRGFWDADDDSTMLSRECSAPHAWIALTGEKEVDDAKEQG